MSERLRLAEALGAKTEAVAATVDDTVNGDLTVRLSVDAADPDALREIADGFNESIAGPRSRERANGGIGTAGRRRLAPRTGERDPSIRRYPPEGFITERLRYSFE